MNTEGGELGTGAGIFPRVRFLLSGWVTMEVWNVVGQRVRWGGGVAKGKEQEH